MAKLQPSATASAPVPASTLVLPRAREMRAGLDRAGISRDALVELDKRYVWHPYTPMQEYIESAQPLVIRAARGSRLFDMDGRSYIDGNSSWWSAALGHDHPRLVGAMREQLESLTHVALAGITHAPAALLAERLVRIAPGLSRVFFSDDGSTSVEVALKLCLQYWHQNGRPQRTRFVALEQAFHGDTIGAAGVSGVEVFRRPFASVLLDCVRVEPDVEGYDRAFEQLERLLRDESDTIAGVLLEPIVQGAAGMRMYSAEWLRFARQLTARHDTFLILDEVFTGFGRTGPFWAAQHAGVVPDVLCTAKGLSGGFMPFAATLTSERIFEGFLGSAERAFYYGHTFCGNPLGASLALEVLDVFEEEGVIEQAQAKANRIAAAFQRFSTHPGVISTRTLGMVAALDLRGGSGYLQTAGKRVCQAAIERGAYLRPLGNTVYITPPLNIPEPDLEQLLEIFEESLRVACA
ncbi:MAG TPA: adenosylmethionine--8-amino-7-oxononanoate transaminase [Polyangiaceae bacterium]|nr:adenosylmethionine--8-amino-7-oxononanoate transaminase [Polyangiaceae bacterium]